MKGPSSYFATRDFRPAWTVVLSRVLFLVIAGQYCSHIKKIESLSPSIEAGETGSKMTFAGAASEKLSTSVQALFGT
jgi:hypothetical protein